MPLPQKTLTGPVPPAVSATPPALALSAHAGEHSSPTTASADAAGGRGNLAPVEDIEPVEGWVLMTDNPLPRSRFATADYFARCIGGDWCNDMHLDVSRFAQHFTWTQERFAWFVENGFPPRRGAVPWFNELVDAEIARDAFFDQHHARLMGGAA